MMPTIQSVSVLAAVNLEAVTTTVLTVTAEVVPVSTVNQGTPKTAGARDDAKRKEE